jgi:hypothetical protein
MKFGIFFAAIFSLNAVAEINAPIDISQWPTHAKEVCDYKGTANLNGVAKARTEFTRTEDLLTVRATVEFSGSVFGMKKAIMIDETMSFDARTGQTISAQSNQRDIGCIPPNGKECIRSTWDDMKFGWGATQEANRISTWRIVGEDGKTFAKEYPKYAKYWPLNTFGQPWFQDFYESDPRPRSDLDATGFNKTLVTPIVSSFFLSRYLDPNKDKDMSVIVRVWRDKKEVSEITPAKFVYDTSRAGTTVIRTGVNFGEFKSPKDKPSILELDNATHQIKLVTFFMTHPMAGEIKGTITPVGCHQ